MKLRSWVAGAVFAGTVGASLAFFATIAHIEPIIHDGWVHAINVQERGFSLAELGALVHRNYFVTGNPRIGHPLTAVLFAGSPTHEILTPAILVTTFLAIFVLATGRFPRPTRLYDSYFFVLVFALCWISTPLVGPMWFYRPFTANYVYGFWFQLWMLVAFRLQLATERPRGRNPFVAVAAFAWGVLAGMTNEHTGPTTFVALAGMSELYRRQRRGWPAWMISGPAGVLVGWLMLYLAPSQLKRYKGLAQQSSVLERIVERGVDGTVAVLAEFLGYLLPLMCVVLVAVWVYAVRRAAGAETPAGNGRSRRLFDVGPYVLAALAMLATTLASPIVAPRLLYAPATLLVVAGAIALHRLGRDPVVVGLLLAIAVPIHTYHVTKAVSVYRLAHREFVDRMERLEAAPPDSVAVVPMYTRWKKTRWMHADGFRAERLRRVVARRYFGLKDIRLANPVRGQTLTVIGARLALDYTIEPELEPARARAVAADLPKFPAGKIDEAGQRFEEAVERLRAEEGKTLLDAELRLTGVDFDGAAGRPLYVAQWDPAGYRAAVGTIEGDGRGAGFVAIDPDGVMLEPSEAFLVLPAVRAERLRPIAPGDGPRFAYEPWRTGSYLVAVCNPESCWLAATFRAHVDIE